MPALTVPTIFTAVDKLSSVISKMQGNVGKFASESQKRYAQMSRSAQNWSTNARQVAMSAGIMGAAIVAPLVLSVKKAMEFEDQMANIGTLVDTTKEDMKAMGNGVLDVFRQVPVPMEQLTEALYKIRSAGIPAAQAMDVLNKSAVLGIAGRGTAVQAADALTSAMNVFRDEGLSTNKIASMLFETVKVGKTTIEGMSESFGATANVVHAGGVQLKDFLAATAAMTVMGEPATQAMNQIRASVFGLEKPTTRMAFLFHSLGVKNVHELISKFGNLGNAMSAIEDRGNKLGVNMAKAWGKVGAYAAVISLTGNSKGAYNNNLASMARSEADLAAGYAEKLQTMKAQSQLLQNEIQYFAIKAGTVLIPVLVKLAKEIQPIVESFGKWIDKNPGLAGTILKVVGGLGLFLLAIAPLALIVGGVADAVRLYAGINSYFAASAVAATAATEAQTAAFAADATAAYEAAYATKTVAGVGFGGLLVQLTALGAIAYEIDQHWKSWGDSITALLGPFGELFNMIEQIKGASNSALAADDKQGGIGGYAKSFGDLLSNYAFKTEDFFTSPLRGVAKQFGLNVPTLADHKQALLPAGQQATIQHNNSTQNNLSVDLNDPFGMIKSTKSSGPLNIPVKVTSTTGNK